MHSDTVKKTASLPVFILYLYVFWFWQLLYYPLLSCYFSNFLQDWPYVTLLSAFLVPFLSFSFFSLLTWVCGTDGTHRQLLLIAWVWSFVVFVPLILLLCKSFPLLEASCYHPWRRLSDYPEPFIRFFLC